MQRFVLGLLFVSLLLAACGTTATTPAAQTGAGETTGLGGKALRIGSDTAYPPFEFVNESNQIVGFDVDLLNAICEKAGCTATFQTANFDGIFAALAAGEYDAVASAVTITAERAERVDFTRPYLNAGQIVSVRSDSDITGPDSLKGRAVGVQRGTTGDIESSKLTDEAMIKRYDTIDVAMQALAQGDVDAVVADAPTSGDIIAKQFKDKLKMVGDPFTTEYYGIAVRKETPEVTAAFNAALDALIKSGELAQIAEKWGIPGSATQNLPESGLSK